MELLKFCKVNPEIEKDKIDCGQKRDEKHEIVNLPHSKVPRFCFVGGLQVAFNPKDLPKQDTEPAHTFECSHKQ